MAAKVGRDNFRNRKCSLEEKEWDSAEFSPKSVAGKSKVLSATEIITN